MVSNTQQVERIRKRKKTTNGKGNKRLRRAGGTPAFPIHPEGYPASAPDALRPVVPVEAKKKAPKKIKKAPAKKAAK